MAPLSPQFFLIIYSIDFKFQVRISKSYKLTPNSILTIKLVQRDPKKFVWIL